MTAFSGNTFTRTQHGSQTRTQVERLQHAVLEATEKLEKVQEQRRRLDEETQQLYNEQKKRMDLMSDKAEVVDVLQRLGLLLQQERELSERLKCPGSAERKQMRELQERHEHVTNKVRSLEAEIEEVKQQLAEMESRCPTAKALGGKPKTKSKKQSKPK